MDSRGLIRIQKNPSCMLQAAMIVENIDEREFYQQLMGQPFEGEYGERVSARRVGLKFENNIMMNNAALLRQATGRWFGSDPESLTVRDMSQEGCNKRICTYRTRQIIKDLRRGNPVPDLIIKPVFSLPIGPGLQHVTIEPDFAALDRKVQMYVPGESKAFITRDQVADPPDIDRTRRQAAVQVLAMRAVAIELRMGDRVRNRAIFVFRTPFGLQPAEAQEDPLESEVFEAERAINVLRELASHLISIREASLLPRQSPLADLVDELPFNYQENCVGTCLLAKRCERLIEGQPQLLGDDAASVGSGVTIERLVMLSRGERPSNGREAEIQKTMLDAARLLGIEDRRATA